MTENLCPLKTCLKIGCQQFPITESNLDQIQHLEHQKYLVSFNAICDYIHANDLIGPQDLIKQKFKAHKFDVKSIMNLFHVFKQENDNFIDFLEQKKSIIQSHLYAALPNFRTIFQVIKGLEKCQQFEPQMADRVKFILHFVKSLQQENHNPFDIDWEKLNSLNIYSELNQLIREYFPLKTKKYNLFQELARMKKLNKKVQITKEYQLEKFNNTLSNQQRKISDFKQSELQTEIKPQNETKPMFIYTGKLRKFQVFDQEEKINIIVECLQSRWINDVEKKYNISRQTIKVWKNQYINQCLDIVESQNIFYYQRKGWLRNKGVGNE